MKLESGRFSGNGDIRRRDRKYSCLKIICLWAKLFHGSPRRGLFADTALLLRGSPPKPSDEKISQPVVLEEEMKRVRLARQQVTGVTCLWHVDVSGMESWHLRERVLEWAASTHCTPSGDSPLSDGFLSCTGPHQRYHATLMVAVWSPEPFRPSRYGLGSRALLGAAPHRVLELRCCGCTAATGTAPSGGAPCAHGSRPHCNNFFFYHSWIV